MKIMLVIISIAVALVVGLAIGIAVGISWDKISTNSENTNTTSDNTNTGVNGNTNTAANSNTNTVVVDYCETDDDCLTGGCNSEICHSQINSSGDMSICVYHERFSCLALSSCGCVNNKCQWDLNDDYLSCLREYL